MLKVDNYNEYIYDQVLSGKHTGRRRYTIGGLSLKIRSEV